MLNTTEADWRANTQIPVFLGVKPEALSLGISFPTARNPATVHFCFKANCWERHRLCSGLSLLFQLGVLPMCPLHRVPSTNPYQRGLQMPNSKSWRYRHWYVAVLWVGTPAAPAGFCPLMGEWSYFLFWWACH